MQPVYLPDFLLIAEAVTGTSANRLQRSIAIGLAESALMAPFAGFGDVELYQEPHEKAAILCSRIVRNHPLPDGNKRAAYICMLEFVARNGGTFDSVTGGTDEIAGMIEDLAAGLVDERTFTAWVKDRTTWS